MTRIAAGLPDNLLECCGTDAGDRCVHRHRRRAHASQRRTRARPCDRPGHTRDAAGDEFYYPVVRFVLPDGSRQTVQTSEGSWPPAYKVDPAVTVLYDPEHPDQARIASISSTLSLWIWPLVTGILGIAFLLATLLVRWVFSDMPNTTRFDS